jgi:hypothetical protein
MTSASVAHSDLEDSRAAGADLGQQLSRALQGEPPDAVIVFCSPRHDFKEVLESLTSECAAKVLVGSSSSGEFTHESNAQGATCAVAIRSDEIRFQASWAGGLSTERSAALSKLVSGFRGGEDPRYPYRTALVLADALAGQADELVTELTVLTRGMYTFVGGGAGGDERFERRFVFCGTEAIADGIVALEILSTKPVGIGVRHGWQPRSPKMRVTQAQKTQVHSLNAIPAADVFREHATTTGQTLDDAQPLPFFVHNVLGLETGGAPKIRVPLAIGEEGTLHFATEVPHGATTCIMGTDVKDAARAAAESTRDALSQLEGNPPAVALFFDCVATRVRLGADFQFELDAVQSALGGTPFAGCNSIGQIARAEGQVSGFHNCTAVVCVLPA